MKCISALILVSILSLANGRGATAALGNGMSLLDVVSSARHPEGSGFVVGVNQGWMHDDYGSQWIDRFDAKESRRLLSACRELGAPVLRIWLFEGAAFEGVSWASRPTGLDLRKLANIEAFLAMAKEEQVRVYFTLFDANVCESPAGASRKSDWLRVLNDTDGVGAAFRSEVIGPLAALLAKHQDTVYGVDVANEINAFVKNGWFADGWEGAGRFTATWRDALHSHSAVPVTASLGHHDAVSNLLAGRIPASAVDFLDFHVYDDAGAIPSPAAIKALVRSAGKPIVLGEFGQSSARVDDDLQCRSTTAFLRTARDCGLSGALAWRLSDLRGGANPESRFSLERDGRWRPAAQLLAGGPVNGASPVRGN